MRKLILTTLMLVAVAAFVACGDDDAEDLPSDSDPTAEGQTAAPVPDGPPEVDGESTTTASGLEYIEVVAGTGATPTVDSQVTVHYSGYLASDGTKFDSSVDRGEPATFRAGDLVPGFTEGLLLMKVGGKARFIIPPDLGYGVNGRPPAIPGNSTLIFDVEMIETN